MSATWTTVLDMEPPSVSNAAHTYATAVTQHVAARVEAAGIVLPQPLGTRTGGFTLHELEVIALVLRCAVLELLPY